MDQSDSRTASIFAKNIKRLRAMHDLTLKQFAASIGVSYATANRYETVGAFMFPKPTTIDRIADLFQLRIADLFSPDGASKRQIALGDPSLEDAMYILNNKLEKAGFQLRTLKK